MNVHEIADRFKLPIRKLKRLEALGLLVTAPTDDRAYKMRRNLEKHQHLSVAQLIELKRDTGKLFSAIGRKGNFSKKAKDQVEALGDIAADALESSLGPALIYGAAISDGDSLDQLADWLRGIIPAGGCGYHFIACRLMWDCPPDRWARTYKFLPRALVNLRNHPSLAGWSSKETGEGTKFHRPDFDL